MKRVSKPFAIMLAIALLLTVIIGTNAGAASKQSALKVNVLWMHTIKTLPKKSNYMHDWIAANKGIDFQLTSVVEKQEERMNLMLASKKIPDVVNILTSEVTNAIANKWASAGLIEPMDNWLKKYPNLCLYCDTAYNKAVYANKKDGKMYMIPTNPGASKQNMTGNVGPIIREDWLKQVGLKAPTNIDELYVVLKAFRDKIPDVDGKKIIPASFNNFRQLLGYSFTGNWYSASADHKSVQFYFQNPNIVEYMAFMNKLIREDLLDKEVLTQKDDQFLSKLNQGRVGFTIAVTPWMEDANKNLKATDKTARFIPSPPVKFKNITPIYQEFSPNMFSAIVVSKQFAKNKDNMAKLMAYLNWAATDSGITMLNGGELGKYYEKGSDGLLVQKAATKAEREKANNTWEQKSGIPSYNFLMAPTTKKVFKVEMTPETQMAQTVWKSAWAKQDMVFQMAGVGKAWNDKWGNFWGEMPKWEAKAFFADDEKAARDIAKQMLEAMDDIGAKAVVKEKQELMQTFIKNNPSYK